MAISERVGRANMTGGPLRVLIACDHIDYDGAIHGGGRQLIELTRALGDAGVDATVCVLRAPSELGRQLQAEGLPLVFFGSHRASPAPLLRFVQLIRARRIQVLHLTDYGASTFGRLAAAVTHTPTIVQVISHHSNLQRKGFPLPVELAFRALAPFTDRALAISSSVKEFAVAHMGFREADVEVLHYPLPRYSFSAPAVEDVKKLRDRYGVSDGDVVIGSVTRFFPSKGTRFLIEAFPVIARELPRARLMLVGQGPDEAALRERCQELGIAERVIFTGFQREAQLFAACFTVAVVPSLEEGFGLVAVESLSLGVPVVAARSGGLPDVVSDGITGILVPPGDANAIATAVLRIVRDDSLRQRMRDAAISDVQRFSLDRYVTRLIQIYAELASQSSHS